MTHRSLKLWIRKIYRPAISLLLAIVLAITGIPWGLPKASAATINVSVDPDTFIPVYGGQTEVNWSFQDTPHTSTIETCTVQYDPPPPPPPNATNYDPPTPYKRTSLQKLASVPAGSDKQYTYNWNGNDYNTKKPLPEDTYTVCVVPGGAEQYFYFADATINNPAPPAPAYINVVPNLKPADGKHVIRGVAERGTRVQLKIEYTKRNGNAQERGDTVILPPVDVPFDDSGSNDGSHLHWSNGFNFNGYFTDFPLRTDNKPEKYIREWEVPVELHPYEKASITATVERLPSNPYYNTSKPAKNQSGVSKITPDSIVLRYVAPDWNINWEALAGYYYRSLNLDEMVVDAEKIATDNRWTIPVCTDGQECPGYIEYGTNLIIKNPDIAGQISQEEYLVDLNHEAIANRSTHPFPDWWDPINLATGDFSFHHTNMSVQAVMPLDFTVTYHSRNAYNGAVGFGWHHSYEWRLERRAQDVMYVVTPEGAAYPYAPKANGQFETPAGTYNTLTKLADGNYLMKTPQLWEYLFRADGVLLRITDHNGNQTRLTYKGAVLEKVETDGASLSFTYGNAGKLAVLTDHTGRQAKYEYNELTHDLNSIQLPDGALIRFRYNDKHQLEEIDNPEETSTLVNTYDDKGRVISQRDFHGALGEITYVPEEHKTITKDPLGRIKTFEYDDRFRKTAIHYPDGTTEQFEYDVNDNMTAKTDRNGYTWEYVYDSYGNLLQKSDPLGNTTTLHYNQFNQPDEIVDALGNKTVIGYDGKGNMVSITNALGEVSRINRDGRGIATSIVNPKEEIIQLENDAYGFTEFITDPLGNRQRLKRDELHRVTEMVDPLGQSSKLEYDPRDRVRARIDALGQREEFEYDKDSNLKYYKDPTGAETWVAYQFDKVKEVTDALGQKTINEYDVLGRLNKKLSPNGAETEYVYNNVDRIEAMLVKDKDEQGNPVTFVTEFRYDGNGNLVWRKDPKDGITEVRYDKRNLPIWIKDAAGAETNYVYDNLGRLVREMNALGNSTVYEFDAAGRLVKVTDALDQVTSYEYDKTGKLTKTVKPNGAVWQMQYDARGLLVGTVDPLGHTTSMERDALGRVRTSKDEADGVTKYGYDELGRVTSIVNALNNTTTMSYDPLGRIKAITDAKGQTTSYAYDAIGRLTSVTNALGAATGYTYDAVGNITSKTDALQRVTSYRYNLRSLLIEEINPLKEMTKLSYDGNGNVQSIIRPDEQTTTYQYDAVNRLTDMLYADNSDVHYTYDALGRRTAMQDNTGTTKYLYDALNRLTQVTNGANQTIRYEWTPTNQRSKVIYPDGTAVNYGYDLMDRMTSVTDGNGLTTQYTYDAKGLMVSKSLPTQGVSTYQYDTLGQVLNIRHANQFGKTVEQLKYAYDPVGNRIRVERLQDSNDEDDTDSLDHRETLVTDYAYDALNQLTGVQQMNSGDSNPIVTQYGYDAVGNRSSKQSTWGTITDLEEYSYDAANKLLHVQNGSNYKDYTYDLRGNLLKIMGIEQGDDEYGLTAPSVTNSVYGVKESVSGNVYTAQQPVLPTTSPSPALMEQFGWDASNRLIQHTDAVKNILTGYTYDGDGNRITMTVDMNNGNNGNGNRNNGGGSGNANRNGNANYHVVPPGFVPPGLAKKFGQVEEPYPDMHPSGPREGWEKQFKKKHWEFHYTNDLSLTLPEPLQVTDKSQLSGSSDYYRWKETYTYGAGGERLSMNYLPAYDANNGWDPKDGTAGAEPGVAPRTLYYLNDALGSAIGLIEKDGRVSSRYHYDEFGIPLDAKKFDVNWPGPDNLFGYTGLGYDYTSGLTYARARYYKPEIGRFISEDTYKGDITNPQSLNLYTYVWNNPLRYVDPTGHNIEVLIGEYNYPSYPTNFDPNINIGAPTFTLKDIADFLWINDIKTIADPNSNYFDKSLAAFSFIPIGKVIKGGKLVIKLANNEKVIERAVDITDDAIDAVKHLPCNCFTAGTKVQTDEGEKNIEDIKVGDKVLSKDEETGEVAYKEVTATFNHETDEIYKIHVGDQTIEATFNHPFYVVGKGWTFVKDLKVGDLLVQSDGNTLKVDSIELEKKHVTVYNMTVDKFHTYFVSDLGIWVHNTGVCVDLNYLENYGNKVEDKLKDLKDPNGNYANMAQQQGIANFNPDDWKKGITTWENAQGDRVEWHYVINPSTGQILSQKAFIPGANGTRIWADIKK